MFFVLSDIREILFVKREFSKRIQVSKETANGMQHQNRYLIYTKRSTPQRSLTGICRCLQSLNRIELHQCWIPKPEFKGTSISIFETCFCFFFLTLSFHYLFSLVPLGKPLSRISGHTFVPGCAFMFRTSVALPEATSNLFLHYVSRINLVAC